MRRLVSLFLLAALVLLGGQLNAQTFGIFAEKDLYNLDGNLFECDTCGAGILIENAFERWWYTGPDSAYFGDEAMRIVFDGFEGSDRVRFTIDTAAVITDDTFRTLDFSEWNDGEAAFYIKLLDTVDVHFAVRSFRNGDQPGDESDEPLTNWGLNIHNTETWQKIYVDPTNLEGNDHDMAGWSQFAFRSREKASNFIVDEFYMVYGFERIGVYADNEEFTADGVMGGEITTSDDATLETVDGLFGEAQHVVFGGGGGDRIKFMAITGEEESASFPKWNSPLANLVMYIKLNQPLDVSVEIEAMRNGESLNASDEPLSQHGLDVNNTEDWQRIVLDLADGLEGDVFDYSQFISFSLRSRDNASDFMVDEVYVRYPKDAGTGVEKDVSTPASFELHQNYPNPFNPLTRISFNLSEPGMTTLTVYNLFGQKVAELMNRQLTAGQYEVSFDAGDLPTGAYFYKLQSGNVTQVKKMLLLK